MTFSPRVDTINVQCITAPRDGAIIEKRMETMAQDKRQVDAITARDVDFAQWYTDVCKKAELIDYTSVKGMFIYRPYGYAIWENIQRGAGRGVQEDRARERVPAGADPGEPAPEGEGPRGGLRPRVRLGHHGRQREAGGAAVHPAHLRDPVLRALRQHHPLLAGPAQAVQPVVQRAAVGEDLPPLPAPPGVPVAGGPHHARHRRGGPGRDHADAEHLRRLHARTCWPCL